MLERAQSPSRNGDLSQTPSSCLRHPSFNHCRRSQKTVSKRAVFVGAQSIVSLLQTTQIISDVYKCMTMLLTPAQIEPKSFESRQTLFVLPGVDASHVYVRARALGCFHGHISTRTFRRTLTASVDSCAEIKSAPSVA